VTKVIARSGDDPRGGNFRDSLLGAARRSDLIDASIVLMAMDGDDIITSDPDDLRPLAAASGRHGELVRP
jgi:hypothetical protein